MREITVKKPIYNKSASCIDCEIREVCYIFWDKYYKLKSEMQGLLLGDTTLLSNEEIEEICDTIKCRIAEKCSCYKPTQIQPQTSGESK